MVMTEAKDFEERSRCRAALTTYNLTPHSKVEVDYANSGKKVPIHPIV